MLEPLMSSLLIWLNERLNGDDGRIEQLARINSGPLYIGDFIYLTGHAEYSIR